jgi:peptide/nickel transport system substrate-binding protein
MVLERFDQYWGGPSHWRRVVMKEITVDPSRVAALKSGQIDIMNYVPSVDVEWMQKDRAISVFKGPSVYVFNLQPDQRENAPHLSDLQGRPLDKNPFRDVRVREAISLAIDRKTMAERVLDGMAEPANQLLAPGMFGFNARMTPAAYDPDRARRLLAEAGYPQGFQVQLHCTNDRLPGDDKVCAALGQMMARVGIRTAVNAITRTVYFPAQARREYSFFMNGWGTLTGEASYTVGSLLHSKDDKVQLGTFNRTDYANPALDQIIQRASRTLDDGERKRLFERAMEIGIAEDRAIIPVVNLATVWAGRADRVTYKPRQDEDTLAYFVQPKR